MSTPQRDMPSMNTSGARTTNEYKAWVEDLQQAISRGETTVIKYKIDRWRGKRRDYFRRVWWALCDLGTVVRGGDPS